MNNLIIYVNSLQRGGAEHVSINLADYMMKHNVPCVLLTDEVRENEYAAPNGVARVSLGMKGNKFLQYFKYILKLRGEIKKTGADTLLIMDIPQCLLAIPATFGLRVRVIVSERNDPNHIPGKKIVYKVSRFFMKYADGFVFQTEDAKKFYDNYLEGRGTIISNPLFVEKLPEIYKGNRKNTIVSVGRLAAQKNHKLLINAFAELSKQYPEYDLIIFGEGPLRQELQRQIDSFGLQGKISLPGNKSDVLDRIRDAAIFVLSSDYEGMPNVLLEAMGLGIPCISTDCPCGGPRSIIKHEVNGLLFPVGDVDELVKQMTFYIEHPRLAMQIGKNATVIRNELDAEKICSQWYDYLESV